MSSALHPSASGPATPLGTGGEPTTTMDPVTSTDPAGRGHFAVPAGGPAGTTHHPDPYWDDYLYASNPDHFGDPGYHADPDHPEPPVAHDRPRRTPNRGHIWIAVLIVLVCVAAAWLLWLTLGGSSGSLSSDTTAIPSTVITDATSTSVPSAGQATSVTTKATSSGNATNVTTAKSSTTKGGSSSTAGSGTSGTVVPSTGGLPINPAAGSTPPASINAPLVTHNNGATVPNPDPVTAPSVTAAGSSTSTTRGSTSSSTSSTSGSSGTTGGSTTLPTTGVPSCNLHGCTNP